MRRKEPNVLPLPRERTPAGTLFRQNHDRLHRYLVRLGADPDAAADAVQEAFHQLLRDPPRPGTERAWLYRVATNALRQGHRKAKRRSLILARLFGKYSEPEPEPPDISADARERAARVQQALDGMPPKQRKLLLLYSHGFTHREIAQAIGTTTGSVGTMLARALRRFRSTLPYTPEDLT